MAISSAHGFDYEAILAPDEHGELSGAAISRQAMRGALPGLAGLNPKVTLCGDTLVVESRPSERPPSKLWDYITLFIPFAHSAYVNRCLGAATVRSFELELPGLMARARPGHTLRLKRVILAGLGQPTVTTCEVTLCDGADEVHAWNAPRLSERRWDDSHG